MIYIDLDGGRAAWDVAEEEIQVESVSRRRQCVFEVEMGEERVT